jgi:tellurite resistance protein
MLKLPSTRSRVMPRLALPFVPASRFGVVLGLGGLATAWRAAHEAWGAPAMIADALGAITALAWAIILARYVSKWLFARDEAIAEARHPVQGCFVGLAGVSTLIVAAAAAPHWRWVADTLFAVGATYTIAFALWRTGDLWKGGRDPAAIMPSLYLPLVAGGFVIAIVASSLGHRDWGQLAFGAAFFSWLAIESVVLNRLLTVEGLAPEARPPLGIQLAPPCVGAVAYLSVNGGHADLFAHALVGYGVLQALVLARLLPWILREPFAMSYWSFTFGATALAAACVRMAGQGDAPMTILAPPVFAFANIVVGLVALGGLWLLVRGRLVAVPPRSSMT